VHVRGFCFSKEAKEVLAVVFTECPSVTSEHAHRLACLCAKTGLRGGQIKQWFLNQRRRGL